MQTYRPLYPARCRARFRGMCEGPEGYDDVPRKGLDARRPGSQITPRCVEEQDPLRSDSREEVWSISLVPRVSTATRRRQGRRRRQLVCGAGVVPSEVLLVRVRARKAGIDGVPLYVRWRFLFEWVAEQGVPWWLRRPPSKANPHTTTMDTSDNTVANLQAPLSVPGAQSESAPGTPLVQRYLDFAKAHTAV